MPNKDDVTATGPEACATYRNQVRQFVQTHVNPDQIETDQLLPRKLIQLCGEVGYIAPRTRFGIDYRQLGLLHAEFAQSHISLQNWLTVTEMATEALQAFGSAEQKEQYLSPILEGKKICSFALTEPGGGSDIRSIATRAEKSGDGYILNGEKKWISFAAIADAHLVFAYADEKPAAFLVDTGTPGLEIIPENNLLGFRANSVAALKFDNVKIAENRRVGREGMGLSGVAGISLTHARYTTAWGCVGMAEACYTDMLAYAHTRKQFGSLLKDHQLIQQMLTETATSLMSAKLQCMHAGKLLQEKDNGALLAVMMAKYAAARMVNAVAAHAVQLFGAAGVSSHNRVQRFFRDARVTEIIEGTSQVFEIAIARQLKNDTFDQFYFV